MTRITTPPVVHFVHAYDGLLIRNIIDKAPFKVAYIHDDIQYHPNRTSITQRQNRCSANRYITFSLFK